MNKVHLSLFAAALLASTGVAQAVPVNLELALAIDVSGSVDAAEFALQRDGYVDAFNNITSFGSFRPFAVTYIQWSGASQQQQSVGWTLISNAADATAFATAISAAPRAFGGSTAIGSAINFTVPLFTGNGFEGNRLLIDISGDGDTNDGASTTAARNAAAAAGITINGLAIGGASILAFYNSSVITPGGFAIGADTFDDFEVAIFDKLQREIVPAPAALALFGFGALALGLRRR